MGEHLERPRDERRVEEHQSAVTAGGTAEDFLLYRRDRFGLVQLVGKTVGDEPARGVVRNDIFSPIFRVVMPGIDDVFDGVLPAHDGQQCENDEEQVRGC